MNQQPNVAQSEQATPTPDVQSWSVNLSSGLTMQVPATLRSLTTYVLLEQETWFEPEMSLIPLLLEPGMDALDIGANHGIYALEMARCSVSGHVWAFEPTSEPLSRLRSSVRLNGLQDRITVVGVGLAENDCEVTFDIQDNSELNSRGGSGGRREVVRLLALDGYMAAHALGRSIGFVKLDAEGGEMAVLAGAGRFFAEQSPVVMFEFKHGNDVNSKLLEAWRALGFDLFRWSAELQLLRPFDPAAEELAFALNLIAVRPAQQHHLTERGLLATAVAAAVAVADGSVDATLAAWGGAGLRWLSQQPALRGMAAGAALPEGVYAAALRAVAVAHGVSALAPACRLALVQRACGDLIAARNLGTPMPAGAGALLVHVLMALGAQHAAVQQAANLMVTTVPAGPGSDLPFMPPRRSDLQRTCSTAPNDWLRQMLGEFVEKYFAYSSYFARPSPGRCAALLQHPDHGVEIERRYLLIHVLADQAAPLGDLRRLAEPGQTHNTVLWRGLMDSMAGVAPDLGAPRV